MKDIIFWLLHTFLSLLMHSMMTAALVDCSSAVAQVLGLIWSGVYVLYAMLSLFDSIYLNLRGELTNG